MQTDAQQTQDEQVAAVETAVDAQEPAPIGKDTRSSGFAGPVLGGVVAAIAGFILAQLVPNGWPLAATKNLETQLSAQAVQIVAVQDQLANAPKLPPTDPLLADRLTALEAKPVLDLSPTDARISALESRLLAIEKLPSDGSGVAPAAIAALQADIQTLRASVASNTNNGAAQSETATALAAEATKNADELAQTLRRNTALGQLRSALESGGVYAPLLAELGTENDPVAAVLTDNAVAGLPTLSGLKASFPPAARLALDASLRADMGDSWTERATSFLRSQTGARSLEPREGTDPDAILSRAEAALNAGDLATVLTELQALPPEAQSALSEWQALAQTRLAAETAIAALAATIGQ